MTAEQPGMGHLDDVIARLAARQVAIDLAHADAAARALADKIAGQNPSGAGQKSSDDK